MTVDPVAPTVAADRIPLGRTFRRAQRAQLGIDLRRIRHRQAHHRSVRDAAEARLAELDAQATAVVARIAALDAADAAS